MVTGNRVRLACTLIILCFLGTPRKVDKPDKPYLSQLHSAFGGCLFLLRLIRYPVKVNLMEKCHREGYITQKYDADIF